MAESDAEAFMTLRQLLAQDGIELLDAVIFDETDHWWSMHELTSGTSKWPAGRCSTQCYTCVDADDQAATSGD